jgi:hypothetical protein
MLMMALTILLLLLVMLMGRLENCCVEIHHLESETQDKSQTVCLFSPDSNFFPASHLPSLAIFVIGVIIVSPLGMGLLRLTKMFPQDIAFVAIMTALFVFAGVIGALSVLYHSTDTQREVVSVPVLLLCFVHLPSSFLLLLLLLFMVDQRDEHVTEHRKDREISAANAAVTGFRHYLLQNDFPTGLIDFSLHS